MRQSSLSIRARLLLSMWALLALVLILPSWLYYRSLTGEVIENAKQTAIRQLNHYHRMLSQEKQFQDLNEFQKWVVQAAADLNLRLTYVADGGKVIADSLVSDLNSLDNHATRPEIVQAREREIGLIIRRSRVSLHEQIFVARRIEPRGIVPPGILRLATTYTDAAGLLDRLWNSFIVVTGMILAATLFLSYVLIRQIKTPINTLVRAAGVIGSGDFKLRTHFHPGQEFYPLGEAINKMAKNIDDQVEFVAEQKQKLEAVFDGMQEGVMVLDSRGKIQSFNRAFSELVPNASLSLGRRPLETIMNLELQEACDAALTSDDAGGTRSASLQIILDGGRIYDVHVVRLEEERKGLGAIVVFHDISELKRLEKVRQDFVANVSHELRTPLTAIKGSAETLLSEPSPESGTLASFLGIILRNSEHMVKMVDDLLQLARLESRQRGFKPAPVNPADALATAWKACAPQADAKQVGLENALPPAGLEVPAEFDQLVQVFRNLLENGIRYGPPGKNLEVFHKMEGKNVVFGVRDQGPGIARQHQQRIFERFFRLEKHRSTLPGSTGLGLAICRHIVRNHGGRIWVQSPNPDGTEGTTFFFSLPLAGENRAESKDGAPSS
ncbi:HAMP domain-containing sensor histidine kinase [Syntrophobacter fumaroxidans]|uniref:histidine kinase n=1 Tax=Syntrophobacter fumaroxidans (strain DSM 10017 / MPOB) TaxID=335543 RepID=A0LG52_SYNFM|nr:HAMP domain-containing sensor histidine kinase [Syntrophobacter fumaroxidans]ABK16404.1 multi-sensor signal transduction histidine kinase [Syntrophobacter fumaroxidans MPOB]